MQQDPITGIPTQVRWRLQILALDDGSAIVVGLSKARQVYDGPWEDLEMVAHGPTDVLEVAERHIADTVVHVLVQLAELVAAPLEGGPFPR